MKYTLTILAFTILFAASCHKEQSMQIEGVWRGVEPPHWVLIVSDGHYTQKLPNDGYVLEYAYRVSGNTVTLENLSGGANREQVWDICGNDCTVFEVGQDVPEMNYVKIGE